MIVNIKDLFNKNIFRDKKYIYSLLKEDKNKNLLVSLYKNRSYQFYPIIKECEFTKLVSIIGDDIKNQFTLKFLNKKKKIYKYNSEEFHILLLEIKKYYGNLGKNSIPVFLTKDKIHIISNEREKLYLMNEKKEILSYLKHKSKEYNTIYFYLNIDSDRNIIDTYNNPTCVVKL